MTGFHESLFFRMNRFLSNVIIGFPTDIGPPMMMSVARIVRQTIFGGEIAFEAHALIRHAYRKRAGSFEGKMLETNSAH